MAVLSSPQARTPLHHWHAARGACFVESDGWLVPQAYAGVDEEAVAASQNVGLADISAFAKISLLGREVAALAEDLFAVGHAATLRSVTTFDANGPVLACRLTADHLLLLTLSTNPKALEDRLSALVPKLPFGNERGQAVVQQDMTSAYAGFCLIGPKSEDVLQHLTALDVALAVLPPGSCAETSLAGVAAVLVRPPDLAISAVLVYVSWDLAEYIWQRLLEAGRSAGILPIGLAAWRRLMFAVGWSGGTP